MISSHLAPRLLNLAVLAVLAAHTLQPGAQSPAPAAGVPAILGTQVFGFPNFARQARWDEQFLAVPDRKLAQQHLKVLTSVPHSAGTPEDYATAVYVAARFTAAGLDTQIVPYNVLLDKPLTVQIEAFDGAGHKILSGPSPEHVEPLPSDPDIDRFQSDPRILPIYNDSSPAADITAPVVYANYGRLVDFERLAQLGISVKGKIVLVRYGGAYRGVKVYIAQKFGAAGVLIYTDPADDADRGKPVYPNGPDRPDSAAQRGSVQFMPIYPGDPTTPGVASVPSLPPSRRIPTDKLQYDLPSIPANPLSSQDATPILRAMGGPEAPAEWQGALGFPYHLGDSAVTVHMRLTKDTRLRTIWDVIGKIPGASDPRQLVIVGNHRDAWVYGAADPNSGTAALLEAVHGLGVLLHHGWRPARTIIVASWDAEEEGMIGSTEWVEQHPAELEDAVAYFNVDVAVAGPNFVSATVPSLRDFVRQVAEEVPSAAGGSVFEQASKQPEPNKHAAHDLPGGNAAKPQFRIGDLGSGSDYAPFLEHAGIPSTDIGSDGPFSVYHSVFDNYDWFTRFIDPTFAYTQQQARFLGLEILHMADAEVLPYNYPAYSQAIHSYLDQARSHAAALGLKLDFAPAFAADAQFAAAAQVDYARQIDPPKDPAALNRDLLTAERALLIPAGLPRRPWYRHSIYAPGEFTGYEAVVIPGVNEAIDASDAPRAEAQLTVLTQALTRAAATLAAPTR